MNYSCVRRITLALSIEMNFQTYYDILCLGQGPRQRDSRDHPGLTERKARKCVHLEADTQCTPYILNASP